MKRCALYVYSARVLGMCKCMCIGHVYILENFQGGTVVGLNMFETMVRICALCTCNFWRAPKGEMRWVCALGTCIF